MKKFFTALAIGMSFFSLLGLNACNENEDSSPPTITIVPSNNPNFADALATTLSVEAITIRPRALENIEAGDTVQLAATVLYSDGFEQSSAQRYFFHGEADYAGHLIWTSSNESVATISQTGIIEIHAAGETVIHCTNPWIPNFPSDEVTLVTATLEAPPATPDMAESPPPSPPTPPADPPANPNEDPEPVAAPPDPIPADADPYADQVVSYSIGEQGGFNEDQLPHIVLGPPYGGGCCQGSFDVFSLGIGGEIILEFEDFVVFDGEGDDLIVFENAFQIGSDPENIFSEPGIVAVSEDGITYHEFPCDLSGPPYEGCAGTQATFSNPDDNSIDPTDPEEAGGNGFDLADLGLESARFIKIVDSGLTTGPIGPNTAGFDLDAVVIVNGAAP